MMAWLSEIKRDETILRLPLWKEIIVCMNPSMGKSSENSKLLKMFPEMAGGGARL